ncbi:MAG: hypothetical protein COA45_06655 [Zetaproteobacteria bacterium]|nr:MAG: hypothetical protein COA45_06655 [Zetaproteobacteria bacterium]
MSNAPAGNVVDVPTTNSMAAFSNQLKELTEALGLLYIGNNASGRNKFRDKWPDVALFIYGDELVQVDNDGVIDRERRSELEDQADERRVQIKQTISEIVEKSVDQGSLLFDYVGGVIDIYGAGISRFLYAEDVIERVRPGILASCVTVQEAEDAKAKADEVARDETLSKNAAALNDSVADPEYKMPLEDQKLSVEEQSILSNASDEPSAESTLDDVKPIETDVPSSPVRTLNNPVPDAPQVVEDKVEMDQASELSVDAVVEKEQSKLASEEESSEQKTEKIPDDKPEVKVEEKKLSVSETLDAITPIETGPAPAEKESDVNVAGTDSASKEAESTVAAPDEVVQNEAQKVGTPVDVPEQKTEEMLDDKPEVKVEEKERPVSEVLDAITPIETGPAPMEKQGIEPDVNAADVAAPDDVAQDEVQEVAPSEDAPKVQDAVETSDDKSVEEQVEQPEESSADKIEKGSYAALFNRVAQVV